MTSNNRFCSEWYITGTSTTLRARDYQYGDVFIKLELPGISVPAQGDGDAGTEVPATRG